MNALATGPEAMEPHHRGVVMPWECDDMGHLNIRFQVARYSHALRHLASSRQHAPEWPARAVDRFVFVKEARVGARVACSLHAPEETSAAIAPVVSGCLWDMSSGDVLTRIETLFAPVQGETPAGGAPSFDMAWIQQPADREWISAMGVLPPPADGMFGMTELVTAAVSDANALAVLELSGGSDYRMDESPIGFVVATMTVVNGERAPAGVAAFSARTALLARSRRSLTLRHRIVAPIGEADIATVQSVCVFFDRRSRQAVPIPFDV